MMPDLDPMELLKMMISQGPLDQIGDATVQMVRGMADRVDAEYPDDATRLREAADIIEATVKKVV